jgi:hypothetical protein
VSLQKEDEAEALIRALHSLKEHELAPRWVDSGAFGKDARFTSCRAIRDG